MPKGRRVGAGFISLYTLAYLGTVLLFLAPVLAADVAKDLGVFNIAGALPFSVAPAIAPAVLALGDSSYSLLYAVAGVSALVGAAAILPVRRVR